MSTQIVARKGSFLAGVAIAQYQLVHIVAGVLQVAIDASIAIGSADKDIFAAGEEVPVTLLSAEGTILCIADNAITAGVLVYGQALGRVGTGTGNNERVIGVAMETTTAAGDIIEVMPWAAAV